MKVLVLGGSRFIGLHLVRLLNEGGHQVAVLNRGQTQADIPDNVVRLIADRTDTEQVKAALKDGSFDAVFDISAYTMATLKPVVEALEGRVGHFVFCSTTAVYGPNDTIPIEEDFPIHRSPDARQYARDKIECEDFLVEEFNQRGFPMTILRPPYVYGPDNYLKAREFSYFARLKQGRKIIIPGDGLTPFHSVHVDDLADAFALVPGKSQSLSEESDSDLSPSKVSEGQAYTICSPDAITANGYVRTIAEIMGVSAEIVNMEPRDYNALDQELYPFEWAVSRIYSTDRARRDLNWSPNFHMRDGLEMTYRWWLDQGLDKEAWDFSNEDEALLKAGSGLV